VARLVALGDAHLGRTHLAHLRDDDGRNVREEDFLRSFAWAVDETIRREPDGFVWLGDVFDHARPTYRTFSKVLVGLKRLRDAGLAGVAISGNHDTPRVRGTGSPYAALEEVFGNVAFAWTMRARTVELGGVLVHAVPQTLSVDEFRDEVARAATEIRPDAVNLLIAHVALTSLPPREARDVNELEVEEGTFDARFDRLLLGHYHVCQEVSRRTWYAGATDSFNFSDRPAGAGPKGLVVLDTETGLVEHVANPTERPLVTVAIEASGLSPGELVESCAAASAGSPEGAIVRIFLNHVDPATYRLVSREELGDAVPHALHVQPEPDFAAGAIPVQSEARIGSLESEWAAFVERQDLVGLDRDRVVTAGARFLDDARGDTV
jgi:DNA repair exonuclease SbcCD nuclease subunit